ncbi:MAG TPA: hypothetical protein H9979_02880 [Candidatus Megamonas gallistercoris]|nr:hypothetical protein [Candidatus Megamonas gallistercoris]
MIRFINYFAHSYIIAYKYKKLNIPASIAYENSPDLPYIPSAKVRGFTAHLVKKLDELNKNLAYLDYKNQFYQDVLDKKNSL